MVFSKIGSVMKHDDAEVTPLKLYANHAVSALVACTCTYNYC